MASLARALELLGDPQTGYMLTVLDAGGRLTAWGPTAERLTGYPAGEVLGSPFSVIWADAGATDTLLRRARSDGELVEDAYLSPKHGERFLATLHVTSLDDDQGVWAGFVAMISIAPAAANAFGVPDRVAKTLLDTVVHPIYSAGLELNGLLSMATDPRLRQRVVTSIDRLDEALRNLRSAIGSATPPSDPW